MTHGLVTLALVAAGLVVAATPAIAGDPARGAQLAQQWCANCHMVSETAPKTVGEGPPSFPAIAQSGLTPKQLRAFLSHKHGAMPDLSLTRAEIDDLIAYIETLR
jgi:mono/diheme cytochrome c family protein